MNGLREKTLRSVVCGITLNGDVWHSVIYSSGGGNSTTGNMIHVQMSGLDSMPPGYFNAFMYRTFQHSPPSLFLSPFDDPGLSFRVVSFRCPFVVYFRFLVDTSFRTLPFSGFDCPVSFSFFPSLALALLPPSPSTRVLLSACPLRYSSLKVYFLSFAHFPLLPVAPHRCEYPSSSAPNSCFACDTPSDNPRYPHLYPPCPPFRVLSSLSLLSFFSSLL